MLRDYDRIRIYSEAPNEDKGPIFVEGLGISTYVDNTYKQYPIQLSSVDGLGDAASKNVGTTAGTVAAGDDPRFGIATGAVLKTGDTMSGGLSFGSAVALDVNDVSRHLALYGSTYGLNVTSNTLNYVCGGGGTSHNFTLQGTSRFSIQATGTYFFDGVTWRTTWHEGNLDPLTRTGSQHTAGKSIGSSIVPNIASAVSGQAALEINNGGNPSASCLIAFHRPGSYAAFFGLDTDNQFKIGGWSMGAVARRIWHEGILPNPASQGQCSWNTGVTEFGLVHVGTGGGSTADVPAPYVLVGMRNEGNSNIRLRAVAIRNY